MARIYIPLVRAQNRGQAFPALSALPAAAAPVRDAPSHPLEHWKEPDLLHVQGEKCFGIFSKKDLEFEVEGGE